MKIYTPISYVEMANDKDIFKVSQSKMPDNFTQDLKGYYGNDLEQCCHENQVGRTKAEAIEMSSHIIVRGFGKHSGEKVWQLPQSLKTEISKHLKAIEIQI